MKISKKTLIFDVYALEDLRYWMKVDKAKALKIMTLIEQLLQDPFTHSSRLKYFPPGCWCCRIDCEHRLVYQLKQETLRVLSCRFYP